MNLPFDIRLDNIVDYNGPLGQTSSVRVNAIEPFDEHRQMYTLQRPYGNHDTFVGYTEHIRPIFLTEGHLRRLGFHFDPELRRYTLHALTLGSFGYAEGNDPMNMTYVYLGFRLISPGLADLPTIDEVKENTIEIPYLHTLQNYCLDNGIQGINFLLIR